MYLHASPMVAPTDSEVPRMVMDRAPCESKYLPEKMDPAKVRNDCSVPIHLRTDMSSKIELSGWTYSRNFGLGILGQLVFCIVRFQLTKAGYF